MSATRGSESVPRPPATRRFFTCESALVDTGSTRQVWQGACIEVDEHGQIAGLWPHRAPPEAESESGPSAVVHDLGHALVLPGMINSHSHAFQRSIRGATAARGAGDPSSFWSWRTAMYGAVAGFDPEGFEAATRRCFSEMLAAGITCVGEFHYVHHRVDGQPYDDANELSFRVIRAAEAVGLRMTLLEVFYERCEFEKPALPEQARFCDASVQAYLERVERLRELASPALRVGITPHSVRAVTRASLEILADYATRHDLPMHAHVSEQPAENASCQREHGMSPTQLLGETGCLARPGSFTAVHAIHMRDEDFELLAEHNACACPSTEADLGDGIIPVRRWQAAGSNLCLGTDSNALVDLVQEARLLEMHERLRTQSRLCLLDSEGRVAPVLADAATCGGARALGWPELGSLAVGRPFDAACVDLDHPIFADLPIERALDVLFTSGTAAPISEVWVAGVQRYRRSL